jgi:hypothetical protein
MLFQRLIIKVLFRLLGIKTGEGVIDSERIMQWVGNSYPDRGFHDYIFKRNMRILEQLGEGVEGKEAWILLGGRLELGKLLTEAKNSYATLEATRQAKIAKNAKQGEKK